MDRLTGNLLIFFLAAILNRNFRLQTSEFRFSEIRNTPVEFFFTFKYIFVCQMELCSECPVHTLTCLSGDWCITVCDASPALKQH